MSKRFAKVVKIIDLPLFLATDLWQLLLLLRLLGFCCSLQSIVLIVKKVSSGEGR
jgi:hypothetical protein